jgi:hypothetical protein
MKGIFGNFMNPNPDLLGSSEISERSGVLNDHVIVIVQIDPASGDWPPNKKLKKLKIRGNTVQIPNKN